MHEQLTKPSTHSYADGVRHYLNPKRRDNVKVHWEEPFTRSVLERAIVRTPCGEKLHVLDVGCGTGDGYALLSRLKKANPTILLDKHIDYLGVDLSEAMVQAGEDRYADNPNVRFTQANMLEYEPEDPVDFFLSCGVPYSHLTADQTEQALTSIFQSIRQHQNSSVVMVDVLGRYSIEWTEKWDESRWMYRMSFFATDKEMKPTPMSFYSAEELGALIYGVAADVGCTLTGLEFFDRSIMVGRHTSTGEFNGGLPRYRNIVNNLMDPDKLTNFEDLIFPENLPAAPENVERFFTHFAARWNGLLKEAADICGQPLSVEHAFVDGSLTEAVNLENKNGAPEKFQAKVVEPALAELLRQLEADTQPGLGVGHTLTAVVYATGVA